MYFIELDRRKIPVYKDQSILEALEKAGIEMNYQCRNGICGTCRCRLVSGEIEYLNEPFAMTKKNEIFICIAKAKTSVKLKCLA